MVPADCWLGTVLARFDSGGEIYLEEGNLFLGKENYDQAAAAYRHALDHNPALAPAAFNLARASARPPP